MFWNFLKVIFFQVWTPHFNVRNKKERELITIKELKNCLRYMNKFNSLKQMQQFDTHNSNKKKVKKKIERKKKPVHNFWELKQHYEKL